MIELIIILRKLVSFMLNKSFDHTFSYTPLFENLEKFGLAVSDLRKKAHVSDSVIIKLYEGEPVLISILCKIALSLGLELSDVVAIDTSWTYDESKELRKQILC